MAEAPLNRALLINLLPDVLLPFIAKKMIFFFKYMVSKHKEYIYLF